MKTRRMILALFITCLYASGLLAQNRLGVYAAAFYNVENLWDTEKKKVMKTRRMILALFITCLYASGLLAQNRLGVYAAAFYNVENLWDTEDDPNNKGDDEFTPKS